MDGRVLSVSRAVDRGEAERLTVARSKVREARDKDKRRLYLLSEGTIPSNSRLYEDLSMAERNSREESVKQRQALVKDNPALHLSLTRLSIRNIPQSLTSKALKELARKAVVGFASDVKAGHRQHLSKEEVARGGEQSRHAERVRKAKGKGIVKQAKVVFESKEGSKMSEKSGVGRSRGYGFIEYTSHRWALMALRWLNGHTIQSQGVGKGMQEPRKRLIVEFAIENAQVIAMRQARESKACDTSKPLNFRSGPLSDVQQAQISAASSKRNRLTVRSTQMRSDRTGTNLNAQGVDKLVQRQHVIGRKRMRRKTRKASKDG